MALFQDTIQQKEIRKNFMVTAINFFLCFYNPMSNCFNNPDSNADQTNGDYNFFRNESSTR